MKNQIELKDAVPDVDGEISELGIEDIKKQLETKNILIIIPEYPQKDREIIGNVIGITNNDISIQFLPKFKIIMEQ